jgi:hypothetical protein
VWTPDGAELRFVQGDSMMAVEVTTKPTFAAGRVERLFADSFVTDASHHLYEIAHDDRRLAGEKEGTGTLVLAEHWLERAGTVR